MNWAASRDAAFLSPLPEQTVPDDFGAAERHTAEQLIALALQEDLGEVGDLTTRALIDTEQTAAVQVIAREAGVLAGGPVAALVFERLDSSIQWTARIADGDAFEPGTLLAEVIGPLREILTGERTALNFLTHLSGIATLTRKFVNAVAGTHAKIVDTRKTHPGYRVLEKYAVRMGGGTNHRMGLYDGMLIKDNHLAGVREGTEHLSPADAVRKVRQLLTDETRVPIEVEVDTLAQLRDVLTAEPDQVLLDNMDVDTLREAVRIRNEMDPAVELEASGGVTLQTVRGVAETGVERISVGALTHSATYVDIGFDWKSAAKS